MADIANYFSNSKEFLKQFTDPIRKAVEESNITGKVAEGLKTATEVANRTGEL